MCCSYSVELPVKYLLVYLKNGLPRLPVRFPSATLTPILPVSSKNPSVMSDSPPGPSTYRLASLATCCLSLAKGATVSWKAAGFTYSVYSILQMLSMSVPFESTLPSRCHSLSRPALFGCIHVSSSSGCSPGRAWFLFFHRVTGMILLVGCVLGTTRSRRPYIRCLCLIEI